MILCGLQVRHCPSCTDIVMHVYLQTSGYYPVFNKFDRPRLKELVWWAVRLCSFVFGRAYAISPYRIGCALNLKHTQDCPLVEGVF